MCDCDTGYDLQADGISCTGMVIINVEHTITCLSIIYIHEYIMLNI